MRNPPLQQRLDERTWWITPAANPPYALMPADPRGRGEAILLRRIQLDGPVGRVPSSCRNVRQPDHVLANSIAGHQAERRPGAGEEGLAATQHDGVEVESILIDKTKIGQAARQIRSG